MRQLLTKLLISAVLRLNGFRKVPSIRVEGKRVWSHPDLAVASESPNWPLRHIVERTH